MLTAKEAEAARTALGRSTLFKRLSDAEREALIAGSTLVNLAPGGQLFLRGDPGDAVFVVIEGEVEIGAMTADARSVRIAALGAGAVIGEMALLDGGGRSADAHASRRSALLRIGRDAILGSLKSQPEALLELAVELSQRLRHANALLESTVLLDLGGRLARLLLQESGARGVVALPQGEIARRIGASREKVNRKLSEWRDAGYVSITRAGVRLDQPDALAQLIADAKTT